MWRPAWYNVKTSGQPQGLPLHENHENKNCRGSPCGCPRCRNVKTFGQPQGLLHENHENKNCRGSPCGCPRGVTSKHSGNHKGCPYTKNIRTKTYWLHFTTTSACSFSEIFSSQSIGTTLPIISTILSNSILCPLSRSCICHNCGACV